MQPSKLTCFSCKQTWPTCISSCTLPVLPCSAQLLPTPTWMPACSVSTTASCLLQEAQATLLAKEDDLQQMREDMADLRRQLQAVQHPSASQHQRQRQRQQQPIPGLQQSTSPELHREAGPAAAQQGRPVHVEVGWVHTTSWWPLQICTCAAEIVEINDKQDRALLLRKNVSRGCMCGVAVAGKGLLHELHCSHSSSTDVCQWQCCSACHPSIGAIDQDPM